MWKVSTTFVHRTSVFPALESRKWAKGHLFRKWCVFPHFPFSFSSDLRLGNGASGHRSTTTDNVFHRDVIPQLDVGGTPPSTPAIFVNECLSNAGSGSLPNDSTTFVNTVPRVRSSNVTSLVSRKAEDSQDGSFLDNSMFPLDFLSKVYSNSRDSTISCRSTSINHVFHTPPLARLEVRKVTPHAPPIIQTERLLNAGMVSLSNDPTTCIGNVPQLFLMDDAVSVRGDAVDAVGSNLYDDSALPSANLFI